MKKLLSVMLIVLLVCFVFAGCGKTDATKNVEQQIADIGSVNADSGNAIDTARKAYDALSDAEKSKVKNYEKLEQAENDYNNIITVNNDIAAIINASTTPFSDDTVDISELVVKAAEITEAYKTMSEERKAQVKDYDKLADAAQKLNSYITNAQDTAAKYVKAFLQIHQDEKLTVTGVYCIKQIRNNTDEYHFFALTYKDEAGKEQSVYAKARCTTGVTAEAIAERAESFFAKEAASKDTDAKQSGNMKLDVNAVLEKAK